MGPRISALFLLVVASGCSLVSLSGLTGGVGPTDASSGGPDAKAGMATGYPAQVLADGPVAYWRFGEASGKTAVDSSGHGNDATYQGGITLGAPGALAGDSDTAATFDGTSGFVTAGNLFAFSGQNAFSLEAWVSVQPQSSYVGVITRNDAVGGPPSEGFLLFVDPSDGPFGFQRLDGPNTSTAASVASPAASGFTYVVATFDGLELVVYVNGESQGSQTAAFSIVGAVADFVVGAEAGGADHFFAGTLDEVAVYDLALPADRVAKHYVAGLNSP
jgi:hypothetical protein